jgi:hypothetical protein
MTLRHWQSARQPLPWAALAVLPVAEAPGLQMRCFISTIEDQKMTSNPLLPCLFLAGTILASARCAQGAEDMAIWRASASMIDAVRVTYSAQYGPTDTQMERIRQHPFPPEQADALTHMLGRARSTVTSMRQGKLKKLQVVEERSLDELVSAGRVTVGPAGWQPSLNKTRARTPSAYKVLDSIKQIGSVWADWPDDPENLLDLVIPPGEERGSFAPVAGQASVYDFTSSDGKSLCRYHLDPQNGMMPKRIDFFHMPGQFLYRFIKIPRYECRDGVFIPAEATLFDFATGTDNAWQAEHHFQARQIDTRVNFTPADFDIVFPPGTYVNDRIADISYFVSAAGAEFIDPDQSPRSPLAAVTDAAVSAPADGASTDASRSTSPAIAVDDPASEAGRSPSVPRARRLIVSASVAAVTCLLAVIALLHLKRAENR